MTKKRFYHYTTSNALVSIIESGLIKTTSAGVGYAVRPAAWFSTNPIWENTVRKKIIIKETGRETPLLTRAGLLKNGVSPVRIEVDPKKARLKPYSIYKKKANDSAALLKGLEKMARKWGANPAEWFFTFHDVSLHRCGWAVESWTESGWVVNFYKQSWEPEQA
jgi:hypothetical protein